MQVRLQCFSDFRLILFYGIRQLLQGCDSKRRILRPSRTVKITLPLYQFIYFHEILSFLLRLHSTAHPSAVQSPLLSLPFPALRIPAAQWLPAGRQAPAPLHEGRKDVRLFPPLSG